MRVTRPSASTSPERPGKCSCIDKKKKSLLKHKFNKTIAKICPKNLALYFVTVGQSMGS